VPFNTSASIDAAAESGLDTAKIESINGSERVRKNGGISWLSRAHGAHQAIEHFVSLSEGPLRFIVVIVMIVNTKTTVSLRGVLCWLPMRW
jgi:hypothetical protein